MQNIFQTIKPPRVRPIAPATAAPVPVKPEILGNSYKIQIHPTAGIVLIPASNNDDDGNLVLPGLSSAAVPVNNRQIDSDIYVNI
jgi:hypothetical protein